MKALVTGGAGFIGSHLTAALLEKGYEVVCIDNLSLGTKKNIEPLMGQQKFQFYEMDLLEIEKLSDIMRNEHIDYVFHLAANSDIQGSASDPTIEYRNTYSTTYSILEGMRRNNVKRIFFASTSAVYGDKRDEVLDEDTPKLIPISYYGSAKLGSEALLHAYSYMNDIQALIFRFPNVIGSRLTHGVIYDFIRKLRDNQRELQILGDGKQTKPYIYIQDLVEAIMLLMDNAKRGVTLYNVGVETATSVIRIADIVCEEMGLTGVKYYFTGGQSGWKGDVPSFRYSLKKIHRTGWTAKYTSDEAIRLTVKSNL